MKPSYTLSCIERAITFLANALANDTVPALEDIAAASGLSKFHFHRLYRLATGETCVQTITRLRLAKATHSLRDPETNVTTAAFTAGYGSSQAFAKAFRKITNTTASTVRTDDERLAEILETLAMPFEISETTIPPLRIELARLDPFEVITLRTDGRY
ncbi:MAG: helix-turn-helix transcriptional regulator, partial [Pseudomonadota bacterium]